MKRCIVFVFLLYLSTSLLTAPSDPFSRGDTVDKWMIEIYSDWWEWTERDRTAIKDAFHRSYDKHAWFPDKFDPPPIRSFTIRPEH